MSPPRAAPVAAVSAALLALGAAGLVLGPLSEAPFSPAQRRAGPWRTAAPESVPAPSVRPSAVSRAFHRADYLIDVARAHLAAASEDAAAAQSVRAAETAADLLRDAIAHRPVDAYAWTLLAVAETTARRPQAALAALRRSWRFAPYLLRLARLRARVGGRQWLLLTHQDRATLGRDLETIRDFDPKDFEALLGDNRRLVFLARERGLID